MGKINIPEEYLIGIGLIKDLEPSDIAFLCEVLRNIPQGVGHDVFVKSVVDSLAVDGSEDIAEAVFSFGGLLLRDENDDVESISKQLVNSFEQQSEKEITNDELKSLQDRLSLLLLNASNIKLTFQAYTLMRSYANPVINVSLKSDVRMHFEKDVSSKKPNGFVFFNLGLEILSGNESRKEKFTLDFDDLKKLKKELENVLSEHEFLKSNNKDYINFIEITE